MAYSRDLRERVLAHLEEGHTQESAVRVFKVSRTAIMRWRKQYRETGSLDRKPLNRKPKKLDPEKLIAYVADHPDAYLKEIGAVFGCSGEAVRRALLKLKITFKKRRSSTKSATQKSEKSS